MRVTTALLSATALLSTTVSAAISIGTIAGTNGVTYNVAWTTGTSDPCNQDTKFLSTFPANPCGHSFQLGNDAGLTLEGCGGPLWINQNGRFKDNCVSAENLDKPCGSGSFWSGNLHKTFQCPG
ncbi:uncharacterized protein LAJ45_07995 [Morchella importuna]|uniref:uncharacterized protein n=1 Tax=Morchella importuna TaxID=1174673 RepID=UPI001E8ED6BD|nr:uncharacterized protein LAJ45_07995 [Morchella importuna]KAH8147894.1 hypothetical protein LAJ45_07995 [Morchella importuna]